MSDKRIAELERRLGLIESFLDAEIAQRQALAQPQPVGGSLPVVDPWNYRINPWAGCAMGLRIAPVGFGPISADTALAATQAAIGKEDR